MSTPLLKQSQTVYVVSFASCDELHATGGFLWSIHKHEAEEMYLHEFRESVRLNDSHIVRLLAVDVDTDLSSLSELDDNNRQALFDTVTDELEWRIDELELTARALRQYVPSRTEKDRVPVSRRKR